MNKIYFGMCLHFHQPVGNFDDIMERAYQNCYRPFLEEAEKYPDIKMSMHFSGCLLDYFEDKHPDLLDKVKVMVDRGQVEIVGGGYYEPIFISIPERDRIGQIKMMASYIKKRFRQKAYGIWTPERVWKPELARDFKNSGVEYTILDDEHFIEAGLHIDELFGYFITGENNKEVAIFPSSKRLRYMIPFKMPGEIMDYFKEIASRRREPLFTYGDDAEKFGEWPFTNDWVYKKRWLNKFFEELRKNKDWVVTVRLSDYLKSNPPVKKIKIPEASYQEMMEWSHGSWMNFLKKYPETNQMVSKMHYVSKKVNSLQPSASSLEPKLALRGLYKGQCNCAYWHGVFGGLYLYHLRKAVYEHLINAEKIADRVLHKGKKDWVEIKEVDFYQGGEKAFTIESEDISLTVDPESGGIIRELDARGVSTNLVNSIARHEEEYHKKILAKMGKSTDHGAVATIHEDIKPINPEMRAKFCYDNYIRGCLVDHFIDRSVTIDNFIHSRPQISVLQSADEQQWPLSIPPKEPMALAHVGSIDCKYEELGDFVNAGYKVKKEKDRVALTREGKVNGKAISITKEIRLKGKKQIEIAYSLKNLSKTAIDSIFGVEFNFTMPYLNSDRYSYSADDKILSSLNEKGSVLGPGSFSIKDSGKELDVNLIFSKKLEGIWYFPVKTVSQFERAYELNYQSSCIIPRWQINLKSAQELKFNIWLIS